MTLVVLYLPKRIVFCKGYPFEVIISGPTPSVVLADQVKSLDWRKRRAKRKGTVSRAELDEVRAKLRALIG